MVVDHRLVLGGSHMDVRCS